MSKTDPLYQIDCVADMPIEDIRESDKKDIFFYDEQWECVQNFFLVTTVSKKACGLRPKLLMKHSPKWNDGCNKSVKCLTNWTNNAEDNKMVYWSAQGKSMTLQTSLETSADLKDIMSLKK